MAPIRIMQLLVLFAALVVMSGLPASASEDEARAVKPWDQEAVGKLAEEFSTHAGAAYTAIYGQGGTSGSVGSGSRRDYFRLRDKARMIDREARRYRSAIRDGKDRDETTPIFERLMLEVRDLRVIGRRVMIQEMTRDKVRAAGESLEQIGEYYDPTAFAKGAAPPLGDNPRN